MAKMKNIRKKRRKTKAGNMLCFVLEIMILMALAVLLFLGYKYYRMGHIKIQDHDILTGSEQVKDQTEKEYLVLFINEEKELDDLMLKASVNTETGKIILHSINTKDVFETLDGQWLSGSEIYTTSSASELCSVLNQRLNLSITDYFTVKSEVLIKVTDLLGGVDVNLSEEEADALNTYSNTYSGGTSDILDVLGPGAQTLSGEQALLYIRDAKYEDASETLRRFDLVCKSLFQKLDRLDIKEQSTITDQFLYSVQTTLSFGEFLDLLKGIGKYSIETVEVWNVQNGEAYEIEE